MPIYALCYGVVQPSTGRAGILCRLQKVRNTRANSVRAKFEGKITQTLVDRVVHIPEGESEVIYSDGVVPGYRLHVGKKVRSFELRIERKPKANIHIGDTLGMTADEARTFLDSKDPHKRAKLIDRLLDRDEYASFWALKWADLLRVDRQVLGHKRAYAFYKWIRASLAANKPLDQFAREILTAEGPLGEVGPASFYKVAAKPGEAASSDSA